MRKLATLAAIAALAGGAMLMSPPASAEPAADPGEHLNWGHQLSATEEACPPGDQVLKVVRKVINSLDSGEGLNDFGAVWWAYSDYVQHIRVVETESGVFCATLKSQGSFESVGGDGPGCITEGNCDVPEGRLEAGVVGTFQGGAINTFTGSFDPGGMRTKGSIGTLDGDCNATTGCPGPVFWAWQSDYFTGVAANAYPWWGWVYHAGNNGSWVNPITGNEGNILGE